MNLTKATFCISSIFVIAHAYARPEFFVAAMQFGAKDCGYCHTTPSGGEALNERGTWLRQMKETKGVIEVDVSWLSTREVLLEETSEANQTEAAPSVTADFDPVTTTNDDERPFDYTTRHGDWPSYSGDLSSQKYSPLNQVTRANLKNLKPTWIWEASIDTGVQSTSRRRSFGSKVPDMFKGTPLVAGGRMFLRTRYSTVVAIDPSTGAQLWEYDPDTKSGRRPPMFGFTTRSVAYHAHKDGDNVILLTTDGSLISLSAATGELNEGFGQDGKVDLQVGMRRHLSRNFATWSYSPVVCNDTIIVGSQTQDELYRRRARAGADWNVNLPVGDVRGFNVQTGEQEWVFETVPQQGSFGNDTWENESWRWVGNTNVWSTFSCDVDLGLVYLPVTAPSHHFYGGHRHGDNLFGTSIVALDIKSGVRQWHYQVVHHDIWDYDLPAAPILADVKQQGVDVKLLIQPTKMGYLIVLDRETGKPNWEIEEIPVPASDLIGEKASPTQPFPTWPQPFELVGLTDDDLIDLTPELHQKAQELVANRRYGSIFTPASLQGSVVSPGIGGGANWGGASFDPESKKLFVPSRRMPMLAIAEEREPSQPGIRYVVQWYAPTIEGLPFVKPPWSSVTAYDMTTGSIVFTVPNGSGPQDHEQLRELDLPDLGNIGAAPGLLVTPNMIFLGEGGRPSFLKVIDKDSGREIWRHELVGFFTQAHPITYDVGGAQFIAIATGGTWEPARVTAFRLAKN